jgi:hypothetical protein
MRYTCNVQINKPLDEVVKQFGREENLYKWMEGLQQIRPISGTRGEVGYKCGMVFLHKDKEMELIETTLELDLPRVARFSYESPMGYNEVAINISEIDSLTTNYTSDNYFKLKAPMSWFGFLMKGLFKKQSMKYLTALKNFIESE